jgi:hypothetical protein
MNIPIFISSETGNRYSRPCFDGDGKKIIFMRNSLNADAPPWGLFTVPAEIIEPQIEPSQYYQPAYGTIDATRPDWCWETGQVALTGTPVTGVFPPSSLWVIANGPNSGAREVPITPPGPSGPTRQDRKHNYDVANVMYPSWFPGGSAVGATNYGPYQAIKMSPQTGAYTPLTAYSPPIPKVAPLEHGIWVGMTSVSRREPHPVAFAGQKPSSEYDQLVNQIWIQEELEKAPYLLEGLNAPLGRAPWFSPSGDRVLFESNRLTGTGGNYQLFISNFPGGRPIEDALTPPTWNSVHAKWSPDERWLTFHGQNKKTGENGICLLEL